MINPFIKNKLEKLTDEMLVAFAMEGNRESLEKLIYRHQIWIYNIALRMVGNPQDAEDVTQEVLIKIITNLSTFKGKSSFRTWVYRIVANHVINMKKRGTERRVFSFNKYWNNIEKTPDMDLPDQKSLSTDLSLILEEIKIDCMMGMLLCLNRKQRFIFILGEIFGVEHSIGSEILEISKCNYRQILSRARRRVYNFMREKCGLIEKKNPCHCKRKAKALIEDKVVNPDNLLFNNNYKYKVNFLVEEKYLRLNTFFDSKCRKLFREHPFQSSPDYVKSFKEMLDSNEFQEIFNLNN
jgi:RNA polymerase sigma factor (sigma-70 family)